MFENLKFGEGPIDCVRFSFRAGGAPTFYEKLKNVMIQRKWLLQDAPPVTKPNRDEGDSVSTEGICGGVGKPKGVGIGGLESKGDAVRKNNDMMMRVALDDLESLMGRAKEMVRRSSCCGYIS